jgi:hypothetical protein
MLDGCLLSKAISSSVIFAESAHNYYPRGFPDDVIKYRRKEGGRGGFRRGGRGGRGGQNMPMQRGRGGGMRGQRGGGFPQRIPGGRIAKNRMQNQGPPMQPMPNFRGARGGRMQRGGFIQVNIDWLVNYRGVP